VLEQQSIFAAPGQNVQSKSHLPEKIAAFDQLVVFARAQETVADQFLQGAGAKMPFGHPTDHLQIAQAAGTIFDIGFQIEGGFVVLMATLATFPSLGFEKSTVRPDAIGTGHRTHPLEQLRRADQ